MIKIVGHLMMFNIFGYEPGLKFIMYQLNMLTRLALLEPYKAGSQDWGNAGKLYEIRYVT